MTGLSSCTIAKLSANENVNTDSLRKICELLNCNIGEIMSFSNVQAQKTLYDVYFASSNTVFESEYVTTKELEYNNTEYSITMTKSDANKYTLIKCRNRDIIWEQRPVIPWVAGKMIGEDTVIYRVPSKKETKIRIFVINGKPDAIYGLDDGIFRSQRNRGDCNHIHVMSMAAFKLFE